ncbi:MAG: undecaprenyl-diphosphate phosphatase, partial [Paracoccus sp. (in: a-proteobacteria)]
EAGARLAALVVVGSIPTGIIGVGLGHFMESLALDLAWVSSALVVNAGILFALGAIQRRQEVDDAPAGRGLDALGVRDALVVGTVQVAHAIALEATLSFLGIGLPVTKPSLGLLIANGYDYLLSGSYWISIFPGIALVMTIIAINLVGDRLRDVLNPRLQK